MCEQLDINNGELNQFHLALVSQIANVYTCKDWTDCFTVYQITVAYKKNCIETFLRRFVSVLKLLQAFSVTCPIRNIYI